MFIKGGVKIYIYALMTHKHTVTFLNEPLNPANEHLRALNQK